MKRCPRCNIEKCTNEFAWRNREKGVLGSYCLVCQRLYNREHYNNRTDYYVKKAKRNKLRHFANVRKILHEYLLAHPCVDCGESDPIVLEFDHIRGKKKESISVLAYSKQATISTVIEEISKCEVRCANCHRRRTAQQSGWYSYIRSAILDR